MGKVVIKTGDGNRYEIDDAMEIVRTNFMGIQMLAFPMNDGRMKYINPQSIVSVTVTED